jgi:uncharacterized integral membrane protein
MDTRTYLRVSATVFGIVCVAHVVRAVQGWPLTAGPVDVPLWVSWLGAAVTGILSAFGARLSRST